MIKKQIIEKIQEADKIAFFHHVKPDGDAISSNYGLMLAVMKHFPEKKIVFIGNYEYLTDRFKHLDFDKSLFATDIDESYTAIAGDIVPGDRLEYNEIFQKAGYKIIFDHHRNISPEENQDLYWSEPEYGASSMQAFELVDQMGVELNENIAFWMMIGILTDTGQFNYSLADHKPVDYFGKLLRHISNEKMDEYYNASRKKTQKDIETQSYVFKNVQYKNRVAYLVANAEEVNKYGEDELHWKINSFGNIDDNRIWVEFLELNNEEKGQYHVHLRSNGPQVNEVATAHGGGGHIRAAGCWAKDDADVEVILGELAESVKEYESR